MLTGTAALLLARFGTSLQQDAELLGAAGEGTLPRDVRAAVAFRAEKKRLLSDFLQDLAGRLQVLPADVQGFLGFGVNI